MFHPETHILFTSLTLFNHFYGESCQTVSESEFAKKKKNDSNHERGVVFPNFQRVLCNMVNTFWGEYGRIFDNFTSFDIQKPHKYDCQVFVNLMGAVSGLSRVGRFSRGLA